MNTSRREFLRRAAALSAGVTLAGAAGCTSPSGAPRAGRGPYRISLAEWSLHNALFGRRGPKMDHLDFPRVARQDFGIDGIELVNQFFKDKATDTAYLQEFKRRADGEGVQVVLTMVDGEGALGDPLPDRRAKAVENHHKWADATKFLGGHSIRVNAETQGVGGWEEQQKRAADGLARLSEYCAGLGLNCIVENHGHLSSHGQWLAGVMRLVNLPNCGTLPDFGNFNLGNNTWYDRYQGVTELMPYAKAVSAKSYDFDADGNCVETDYRRMMRIVLDAGYRGWVGIEYEGGKLSEHDGIRATKALLERVRSEPG